VAGYFNSCKQTRHDLRSKIGKTLDESQQGQHAVIGVRMQPSR
jgi:hypothetical protein